MEGWAWETVVARFIEIIQYTLQEFTSENLIKEDEVKAVRRLIFTKLQLDMPEHLQEGDLIQSLEFPLEVQDDYQEIQVEVFNDQARLGSLSNGASGSSLTEMYALTGPSKSFEPDHFDGGATKVIEEQRVSFFLRES